MGQRTNLLRTSIRVHSKRQLISPVDLTSWLRSREKENAMYALEVMLGMTVFRIILPVLLLLAIGEWAGRHGRQPFGHR
jgi:hypothetical protein